VPTMFDEEFARRFAERLEAEEPDPRYKRGRQVTRRELVASSYAVIMARRRAGFTLQGIAAQCEALGLPITVATLLRYLQQHARATLPAQSHGVRKSRPSNALDAPDASGRSGARQRRARTAREERATGTREPTVTANESPDSTQSRHTAGTADVPTGDARAPDGANSITTSGANSMAPPRPHEVTHAVGGALSASSDGLSNTVVDARAQRDAIAPETVTTISDEASFNRAAIDANEPREVEMPNGAMELEATGRAADGQSGTASARAISPPSGAGSGEGIDSSIAPAIAGSLAPNESRLATRPALLSPTQAKAKRPSFVPIPDSDDL
jgi:hypothetical protein